MLKIVYLIFAVIFSSKVYGYSSNISYTVDTLLENYENTSATHHVSKRQTVIANLNGEVLGLTGYGPTPQENELRPARFNFDKYVSLLPRNSQLYKFITQSGAPTTIPYSELYLIRPLRRYQLSLNNGQDYQYFQRADGTRAKIEFNHACPYNCDHN